MSEKIKNFNTMMKNPKNRNIYIAAGAIGILTVGTGLFLASKNNAEPTTGAAANIANVPKLSAIPGSSDSKRYNEMVQQNNEREQQKALDTNSSFVPTIVNSQFNATSPIDMLGLEEQKKKENKILAEKENGEREAMEKLALEALVAPPPQQYIVPEPVIVEPVVVAMPPPPPSQPELKYSNNDAILIAALQESWKNYAPVSERNYFGQQAENNENNPVGYGTSRSGASSQGYTQSSSANMYKSSSNSNSNSNIPDQKAGDIIHAVLDTEVNSSEPSPILATVVSGQFKGAKLLGRFTKSGKKVVLQFNTISIPNYPNSTRITVIAMDPDTRKSNMATDVDNHYFLRYGVLLASTFLSGYAGAISSQNTTTTVTPEGGVIQTTGEKDNKDITREALGSVGTELASNTKAIIAGLEPTIYVAGGTAIGLLFMEDFYANSGTNGSSGRR